MSLLTDGRKLFFLVHLQKTVQSDECDTISVDRRHVFTDRREKAPLPGLSWENCTVRRVWHYLCGQTSCLYWQTGESSSSWFILRKLYSQTSVTLSLWTDVMSLLTDGRKLFFLVHLEKTVQSDECDTISVDRRHVFTDRREKALLPGSSSENCTVRRVWHYLCGQTSCLYWQTGESSSSWFIFRKLYSQTSVTLSLWTDVMSLLTDGRKLFFLVHLQKTVQSDECDTISVDRRHVFTDRREKALLPGSSWENCTVRRVWHYLCGQMSCLYWQTGESSSSWFIFRKLYSQMSVTLSLWTDVMPLLTDGRKLFFLVYLEKTVQSDECDTISVDRRHAFTDRREKAPLPGSSSENCTVRRVWHYLPLLPGSSWENCTVRRVWHYLCGQTSCLYWQTGESSSSWFIFRKLYSQMSVTLSLWTDVMSLLFFVINNFYFLFFHTQHNRISKIKQNKTADTYLTSQGSIKREGEREGQQEHKSHSFK